MSLTSPKKITKKPSSVEIKKTTGPKKESKKIEKSYQITINSDLHEAIQKLKMIFATMTDKEEITDEDVIASLVQSFLDSFDVDDIK